MKFLFVSWKKNTKLKYGLNKVVFKTYKIKVGLAKGWFIKNTIEMEYITYYTVSNMFYDRIADWLSRYSLPKKNNWITLTANKLREL